VGAWWRCSAWLGSDFSCEERESNDERRHPCRILEPSFGSGSHETNGQLVQYIVIQRRTRHTPKGATDTSNWSHLRRKVKETEQCILSSLRVTTAISTFWPGRAEADGPWAFVCLGCGRWRLDSLCIKERAHPPENGRPFGGPATHGHRAVGLTQELVNFAQGI
jgi:hypothetical protein